MKRIKCLGDLETWQTSPAFKELNQFLDNLSRDICGKKLSEIPEESASKCLNNIKSLLDKVNEAVDDIEAVVEISKGAQRYGNKSFRTVIQRIKIFISEESFLGKLFINSFGDPTRIDYGTGHELSFIIFILCSLKSTDDPIYPIDDYAWIGGRLIGQIYLPLVRKIQCKYSLEPAGSHGVWGLDDHQFIPFLLGSSQLIGYEKEGEILRTGELIKVLNFSDESIRREYLYPAALYHIHTLKTRPNSSVQFHHHSPLLYDISGVATWKKIHEGLRRMYGKEVLSKLPVVQHILFDEELFKFQ